MKKNLRILIVEDSENDALLLLRELRKGGYEPVFKRVETEKAMAEAIENDTWDIIISDYSMPRFNGLDALETSQRYDMDIPFIVVSGTIGEDIAVATMKAGAHDYFLKDNLTRLVPAIDRELHDAEIRRAHKLSLEKLRRSERIVSSSTDMMALLDVNFVYLFANDAYLKAFGKTSDQLMGNTVSELYGEDVFNTVIKPRADRCLKGNKVHYEDWFEFPVYGKRYMDIAYSPYFRENNEIEGFVVIARDISESKQAEKEKKAIEAQLHHSQQLESIGNLAGGIAHDFNNILSSVIGYTELAIDDAEKGTPLEDNLQEVYTAGKRARDLVRQILAFARQSDEEIKPIQVATIVNEVLKFIRSSIPTSIEIKQNIESGSLIMGNATQVHQILMNLFTNAAHAMEGEGGILELSLKDVVMDSGVNREKLDLKPGGYIEIKVSDTGVGIAPEIIGSIFDPYFTTKGPGKGTGMGLATVLGIVERYGGKISVDSKPGQGTLFTIYLPITKKHQEHRPYQSELLPKGKGRILFVDDEAPIAKMGAQVLERLGYTVSIRTSSLEALELFRSKPNDFDLVITDMTMPNMGGDELAAELMRIRSDIPVILCTGYSKKISDESAAQIGIKAFAYKPVVKADLAKIVRKVLDEVKGIAHA